MKDGNKRNWPIGGGLLLGMGIGFFFLQSNPLAFVGCMMGGLGLGLILTSVLSSREKAD